MVKVVEYNGVVYRRYEGRLYYNPNGTILGGGGNSLHRQVWLDAGNEIPDGWHVHHIDSDHDNNALSNLDCMPGKRHSQMHMRERLGTDLKAKLDEWRRSDEGQATLRRNAQKMLANTPERQCICGHCGTRFATRHPQKSFCSKACALAVPNAECEMCGKPFRVKPHSTKKVRTCSYTCGWDLRRKNKETHV